MKKISMPLALLIFYCFSIQIPLSSQTSFYHPDTIQKIEIYFSQFNWDYQLDTAKLGTDTYIQADWIRINGIQFDTVGVKYKGSSSFDSTFAKNPLHIELDHFKSQSYQGIKDIKLSNGYADPSMVREVLAYYILGHYMIAPHANFAQVYINNEYKGLYSNTESIGKSFCSQNFSISGTTFIKCCPLSNPGPTVKSNLKYITGADSTAYFGLYELKSDYGWNELVDLADLVTNNSLQIESVLNTDRCLWMLAFNSLIVNLDSYTGVFAQNYYLYKDVNQRFNPIVWDLNMSFGGFPFVGSSNTSMGGLSVAQMKNLSPVIHATDPFWPLINIVMGNQEYRKKYFAHMKTIAAEMIVSGEYLNKAIQFQQLIDTAVQSDLNKFFSYEHFQNGLITDYPVLNYDVPGIANLMSARLDYLSTHAEYSALAPVVMTVQPTNPNPAFNSIVTIQAEVANATTVYLYYRLNSAGNFSKIEMAVKKTSGISGAESSIYSGSFLLNSTQVQYYIAALNNSAAAFEPPRAEYEFHTLQVDITTPVQGEVVINEFLAKNASGVMNEYGEYADWIELHNTTNETINLFGLFISDDPSNLTKFAFPDNTGIAPEEYLVIFADEMPSTENFIHCNFKLSADGEAIIISNSLGNIIDNIVFGTQNSDISMGRCPNSTGDFILLNEPSFGTTNNCPPETLEIITLWDFNYETLVPSTGNGTANNLGNTTFTWGNGITGAPDKAWNTLSYPGQAANSGTAGVQFNVSTTGYQNIHVSYFHRNSGTASRFASMQYTVDGSNWTVYTLYANGPPHDTYNQYIIDFSDVAQASNNPYFGIRILSVFSPDAFTDPQEPFNNWGANEAYRATRDDRNYAATGTWRFDNVTFSGNLITGMSGKFNDSNVHLSISPGIISVSLNTTELIILNIFNIMGQPVYIRELRGSFSYAMSHNLPLGVYIIKITGSDILISKKFLSH